MITPAHIEKRLVDLSKEVDEAQRVLDEAEQEYYLAKADCEIALARERLSLAKAPTRTTVQDKADAAMVACEQQVWRLAVAEAKVRAARGNAARIRTQVDIVRSVGTSVRSSLDIQ